jgi:hypothetical protein
VAHYLNICCSAVTDTVESRNFKGIVAKKMAGQDNAAFTSHDYTGYFQCRRPSATDDAI